MSATNLLRAELNQRLTDLRHDLLQVVYRSTDQTTIRSSQSRFIFQINFPARQFLVHDKEMLLTEDQKRRGAMPFEDTAIVWNLIDVHSRAIMIADLVAMIDGLIKKVENKG